MATITDIITNANIIKNETVARANTADRVGGNLVDIAEYLDDKQSEIDLNTAKVSYSDSLVSANTDVVLNTAKVGYSDALVSANTNVVVNSAKNSYPNSDSTKLSGIEDNAEVNTINSLTSGEPTGSDLVYNIVSLTQAEYDASTPVSTTFYIING